MAKIIRKYARVGMTASLVLTVPVPKNATKSDLRKAVLDALRLITDSDDAMKINIPVSLGQYRAMVYPPKKDERDINENTLFTLKGLELIDLFEEEREEDDVPSFT